MKTCVINVANGIYLRGQERLRESLKAQGFRGDVIFWTDALPPGSPTQDESPMAFKPFAFKAAFEQGYELVLWLDAAAYGISFRGIPPGRPWTDSRSNRDGLLSSDPRVKGHRHDQTAASLIAYELNMRISHLQCMDAIHYEHETWSYVHTLPLTIRMVQNRDIKNGECRTIAVNERLSGESGLLFACRRIVKTIKLLVKHLIIRGRFRRLHT
jgi:hypothetical protein